MSLKDTLKAKAHELLAEIEKLGEEGLEEAEAGAKKVVTIVEGTLCAAASDGLKCVLDAGHVNVEETATHLFKAVIPEIEKAVEGAT